MTGTVPTTQELLGASGMSESDIKRNELARQHRIWLTLPITCIVKQNIESLLSSLVINCGNSATLPACPDSTVRAFAAQIKQLQTIQKLAFDTDTFVNQSTK